MEKDSLKKSYKKENIEEQDMASFFTGSSGSDWLKNLDNKPKPTPQPTPQPTPKLTPKPKRYEAPDQRNDPEKDALIKAFNEKYGVYLTGKEREDTLARFSEKWNADEEEYSKEEPKKDSKKKSNWLTELIAYGSRDY